MEKLKNILELLWTQGLGIGANEDATIETINEYLKKDVAQARTAIIEWCKEQMPKEIIISNSIGSKQVIENIKGYNQALRDIRQRLEGMKEDHERNKV
ncbi:MAG: hypothetical protein ABFC84_16800 [Veillonellales bacterium]